MSWFEATASGVSERVENDEIINAEKYCHILIRHAILSGFMFQHDNDLQHAAKSFKVKASMERHTLEQTGLPREDLRTTSKDYLKKLQDSLPTFAYL